MRPPAAVVLFLSATVLACSEDQKLVTVESVSTVVPIRMEGKSPVVEVKINGSPIDVLFDIGRGTTVAVFPPQLDSIEKRTVGTAASRLSMTGSTGERPIYEVEIIEIGGARFTNATIVEDFHDDAFQESFASSLNAYGFFGVGLIEQYKVVIDYPNSELTLIPSTAPPNQQNVCRGTKLPLMQGKDWGIATKVETDIGELVLVWDTGTPENGVLKARTDSSNLGLNDGDTFATDLFVIGGIDIGPQKLIVWDWSENTPPFDGLMGYDFFVENVVCVDLLNQTMFVEQKL